MQQWKKWGLLAVWMAGIATAHAQILVGQTAGFTGQVAAGVKEVTDGAKLYLDAVNAKGGVNGQKIELISLDDEFQTKKAGENARILIEEKEVIALFLTRGTPHTQATLPWVNQYGVPLIAPSTGAMVLHQPVEKYVFNVRATYQREAEKAMQYLATLGVSRVAVVYADDSFGADGAEGAKNGLKAHKLTPAVLEKFNRTTPDFAPIVSKIVSEKVQAVLLVASSSAVKDAVTQIRQAGSSAQVITLSNNASGGFVKSLGEHARGVIVTQVFPSARTMAYAMVREAQDLIRSTQPNMALSPAMLEGFAGAKVLVEGLRLAGPKPTRSKLFAALNNMKNYDLGGLEVGYSPQDHSGLDFADLSIIDSSGKFLR